MRRRLFLFAVASALGLLLAAGVGLADAAQSAAAATADFPDRGPVLSLRLALSMVERANPALQAAQAREAGAKEAATAAESGYYPSVGVAAVDSSGFPGSDTGLDGFYGLSASPYRSGPSADAYGTWNLVDATVWHAAAAAGYEADAGLQARRVAAAQADVLGLEVYLRAVEYRGDRRAWATLVGSLKGVRDTVARFVRNGQYSEVQRMLIEDQLDDAGIRQDDYDREYRLVLDRLGLLAGMRGAAFECPDPADIDEGRLDFLAAPAAGSPLVLRAEAEAKAAHEVAKQFSAENLPKLELGGSVGYLSDERLVKPEDYSAFAGVTLPLFEGLRVYAGEKAAEREAAAREADRAQAQLELDDFNARMDEEIAEGREDLSRLLPEQRRAARAVSLARDRYLNFLGPLSDLQEALKDRVTVDTSIASVKSRLLLALGSKVFVNGGTLAPER